MADCSFLATDIKHCQSKGKIVTLSLGGGVSQVGFSSASQAAGFATNIWNMFLGSSVYSCSPFYSLHSRRKYVGILSSKFNLMINRWSQKTIWQCCSRWVYAASFQLIHVQSSDIANSVDLDIESGSSAFYNTFVNTLRSISKGAPKQ